MAVSGYQGPIPLRDQIVPEPRDTLDLEVELPDDAPEIEDEGVIQIEDEDGSVLIDFSPQKRSKTGSKVFTANLAEYMDDYDLAALASDLLDDIEMDDDSRSDWKETRARGLDLLGLKIEQPNGDIGSTSAPLEGMSTVRHPLLLEAVIYFQSNAKKELLPPGGPAKLRNDGDSSINNDDLGAALEKEFNHYLTKVDTNYYPDTDRLFFMLGFGGCGFKKIYRDPIRQIPTSESVDASDLIISDGAINIQTAKRITHKTLMKNSIMRRMMFLGEYREVDLVTPTEDPDTVDQKEAEISGLSAVPLDSEDQSYTVYECYCELDLPGFEHKDKSGNQTGIPLPYKVTIEKDSRVVLEIRRNWAEDDEMCLPRRPFVKYPFIPGPGFYDIGLVHVLGNTTNALTAAWREFLDAAMFGNFPGFLYSKDGPSSRQDTNQFRVAPGSGVGIKTGGGPLSDAIMPLPYKEPGPASQQFISSIEATGMRLGGTATSQVAEGGAQNAPVGTTLAMIDQTTRTSSSIHERICQAQNEEFQMLIELFREEPESLWKGRKKPEFEWTAELAKKALEDYSLVPVADPTAPSMTHKLMKAMAVKEASDTAPDLIDRKAAYEMYFKTIGIANPDIFFIPPPDPDAPMPIVADPAAMAAIEVDKLRLQLEFAEKNAKLMLEEKKLTLDVRRLLDENERFKAELALKAKTASDKEDTARMKVEADLVKDQNHVFLQQNEQEQRRQAEALRPKVGRSGGKSGKEA